MQSPGDYSEGRRVSGKGTVVCVAICMKMYARCWVRIYRRCIPLYSLGCHTLKENISHKWENLRYWPLACTLLCFSKAPWMEWGVISSMTDCVCYWPPVHCFLSNLCVLKMFVQPQYFLFLPLSISKLQTPRNKD